MPVAAILLRHWLIQRFIVHFDLLFSGLLFYLFPDQIRVSCQLGHVLFDCLDLTFCLLDLSVLVTHVFFLFFYYRRLRQIFNIFFYWGSLGCLLHLMVIGLGLGLILGLGPALCIGAVESLGGDAFCGDAGLCWVGRGGAEVRGVGVGLPVGVELWVGH